MEDGIRSNQSIVTMFNDRFTSADRFVSTQDILSDVETNIACITALENFLGKFDLCNEKYCKMLLSNADAIKTVQNEYDKLDDRLCGQMTYVKMVGRTD